MRNCSWVSTNLSQSFKLLKFSSPVSSISCSTVQLPETLILCPPTSPEMVLNFPAGSSSVTSTPALDTKRTLSEPTFKSTRFTTWDSFHRSLRLSQRSSNVPETAISNPAELTNFMLESLSCPHSFLASQVSDILPATSRTP